MLKHDLKHVIGACLSETEMIAIAENIWDQTEQETLLNYFMKQGRDKTLLRASAYSHI